MGDRNCLVIQFTSACQVLLGFRTVPLELGGRSKHDEPWHPHVPHLSDDLGAAVPSVLASRAVIEGLACSWLCSLRSFARADPCRWVCSFVSLPQPLRRPSPQASSPQRQRGYVSLALKRTTLELCVFVLLSAPPHNNVRVNNRRYTRRRLTACAVPHLGLSSTIFFSSTQSAGFTQVLTVMPFATLLCELVFVRPSRADPRVHVVRESPAPLCWTNQHHTEENSSSQS